MAMSSSNADVSVPRKSEAEPPAEKDTGDRAVSMRERILREAASLFERNGYDSTTTRQIAEGVGVRQPSVFHHFASKAEIMKALVDRDLLPPTRVVEGLADEDRSSVDRLYEYMMFDLLHIMTSPMGAGRLLGDPALNREEFASSLQAQEKLREARKRIVADGLEAGEFLDLGVAFLEHFLHVGLLGANTVPRDEAEVDAVWWCDRSATLILRGFVADSGVLEPARLEACRSRVLGLISREAMANR